MREDRQESRQIPLFSLAETVSVSSTQTESSHGTVPRSDGLRSTRWLRRGSDAFTSLPAMRCRSDWKDTIVQSSASARQQLGAMIKLGPEVSLLVMQLGCRIWKQGNPWRLSLPLTQGDGTCDHNPTERAINIITSLPYFALGLNTFRQAPIYMLGPPRPSALHNRATSALHAQHVLQLSTRAVLAAALPRGSAETRLSCPCCAEKRSRKRPSSMERQ